MGRVGHGTSVGVVVQLTFMSDICDIYNNWDQQVFHITKSYNNLI